MTAIEATVCVFAMFFCTILVWRFLSYSEEMYKLQNGYYDDMDKPKPESVPAPEQQQTSDEDLPF